MKQKNNIYKKKLNIIYKLYNEACKALTFNIFNKCNGLSAIYEKYFDRYPCSKQSDGHFHANESGIFSHKQCEQMNNAMKAKLYRKK